MLDIDSVHAFVLAADFRSFTRAAEAMETTQSAVSLRIGRLEKKLGRRLLERTPRVVRLSSDGAAFLPAARSLLSAHGAALGAFERARRRLAVGISHHIVGAELPNILKRMRASEPGLALELRIAASRDILVELDRGTLDAGVVLRHDPSRRGGETLFTEPFRWMAAREFERDPGLPLPLATQAEPCSIRAMATDALEAHGIPWSEVFVGGGVAIIGAAVTAGLAVAALGQGAAPIGCVDVAHRLGLPSLPSRDVVLYAPAADATARRSLKALGASFRATRGLASR